jgi:uncharacterized protein (TIGR03435 family)
MLQALLAERFKLVLHRETREGPIYELRFATGGPKLEHHKDGPFFPEDPPKVRDDEMPWIGVCGSIEDFVAEQLQPFFDRPLINKTGLTGVFKGRLSFDPRAGGVIGPPGFIESFGAFPPGPSIFTALQEQLGLKLESSRGPVEVLVIDSFSEPTEN